jgi:hypothetical protein
LVSLSPDRVAAWGPIKSHTTELFGAVEQIPLADRPIIRRRRCIAHAIDRIAGHFPGAALLPVAVGVRREA